ncbi:serine hydrolase domain-containing protein [Streptomyces sp. RKAG337]|uniref:serine hydrolase domain-containing protein n=1 Tax=Streptomyces sp. RKAG337 TaxID=2893404 RepID=UPI002033DEA5|nr:serine hydrolase domain-containing protein [Streptomyces sp. RKAG337]MCM2426807.1 beta-lactamase family protein [Streptomyces sp. RKAG337]
MTRWAAEVAAPLLGTRSGASGTVVALRLGDDRVFLTEGRTAHVGGDPVDADTRFEIGSLTKVLTALLLAEQAARGEVAHDDPVSRFLPPGTGPRPRGAPMTLLHLATHTSGLPRLPPGLLVSGRARWLTNPYAAFSHDDLLRAVRRTRPRFEPGSRLRYSNFAVGLLGHLLVRAADAQTADPHGTDAYGTGAACCYESLLTARVLHPLGLLRTDCAAGLPQATGYWHGRARPAWRIPGLPAAGAARSSGRDLLHLLDALIDPGTAAGPSLRAGLADVIRPRLAVPRGTRRLGLIWNIQPRPGHDLYHHSGGTRGFSSFAGFSPQSEVALVALTNTAPAMNSTFIQRAYDALRALALLRTR